MGDFSKRKAIDSEMLSFTSSSTRKHVDSLEEVDEAQLLSLKSLTDEPATDLSGAWVQVGEPSLVEDRVGKHAVYVVRVSCTQGQDGIGSFEASRRYNDFLNLRNKLVESWPGVIVPPIPRKQVRVRSS